VPFEEFAHWERWNQDEDRRPPDESTAG